GGGRFAHRYLDEANSPGSPQYPALDAALVPSRRCSVLGGIRLDLRARFLGGNRRAAIPGEHFHSPTSACGEPTAPTSERNAGPKKHVGKIRSWRSRAFRPEWLRIDQYTKSRHACWNGEGDFVLPYRGQRGSALPDLQVVDRAADR